MSPTFRSSLDGSDVLNYNEPPNYRSLTQKDEEMVVMTIPLMSTFPLPGLVSTFGRRTEFLKDLEWVGG